MCVKQLNCENAEKEIRIFFRNLKQKAFNMALINQVCVDLFFSLVSIMKQYGGKRDYILQEEKEIFDTVSSAETIKDIEDALILFAKRVIDYLSGVKTYKSRHVINEIVNYVKANYSSNVTLKSIARHFYMNTAYLGRIFKEETGEFFSDFVNKVRVEEARKMLLTGNFKIYEIAQRCGYRDIDYFRDVFKRFTGINPAEFKRK